MPAIWIFIIAMGVGLIIYPRFTIVAIIAPILGLTCGGFFWGLAAIFVPALISWGAFFLFVAIFTVVWGRYFYPQE